MDKLNQWWQEHSPREQIILAGSGIALMLFLIYFLTIEPLIAWRLSEQNQLAGAQLESTEVMQLVTRIKAEKKSGLVLEEKSNLSVLINTSLNENDLIMRGFQPGSKNDARLRLENIFYSSLVQWLYDLEYRHDINIEDLSLTPSSLPGHLMVSIRVSH
jgi:general secretion pathway protein M